MTDKSKTTLGWLLTEMVDRHVAVTIFTRGCNDYISGKNASLLLMLKSDVLENTVYRIENGESGRLKIWMEAIRDV